MSIEERILKDSSCSAYVDTNRKYVEIAFRDGAEWGYEQGCKDMIEKACEWLKKWTYQDCLGVSPIVRLKVGFSSVEELVDAFKQEMEE